MTDAGRTRAGRWVACLLAVALGAAATPASAASLPPEDRQTPAETSGFEATPGYDETWAYIERLAARDGTIGLFEFGHSAQTRRLPLVIVSTDGAFTPTAAHATGKPIVLIHSGIHAGEIDGKDATLMLLRDAALARESGWLDGVILLLVPIYNVDGHERVSVYNRPNQNGPVAGMGFRTTTDGHDLNRDHLKLDTPEARAMVGLFNSWRPHLHVDNHVTNGVDHDWVLTYAWAEAPQAAPSIDAWLRENMPPVLAATEAAGHRTGPYVSLIDRSDPSKGFNSYVGSPRYSSGYYPLRNRPSILVENHAHKPYEDRVRANLDFMRALLTRIAAKPDALTRAVARAEARTVARGRPRADPSTVALRYKEADSGDTIRFPVYKWRREPSRFSGGDLVFYERGEVAEIEVPWIHRAPVELEIARPRGYLVLRGWPAIEERLRGHGLDVRPLREPIDIEVETMRIDDLGPENASGKTYQGRTRVTAQVARRLERRRLPRGTLWIPADQPDFEVAVQLFEPEAPDSLVSWGLLSIVAERKEYIGPDLLEELTRKMLEDPGTRAAWEQALKDEAFAADFGARYEWWYRRTPFWDETVGLLPVMRLLTEPSFETAPWEGPR